jgi:hypothetical protein
LVEEWRQKAEGLAEAIREKAEKEENLGEREHKFSHAKEQPLKQSPPLQPEPVVAPGGQKSMNHRQVRRASKAGEEQGRRLLGLMAGADELLVTGAQNGEVQGRQMIGLMAGGADQSKDGLLKDGISKDGMVVAESAPLSTSSAVGADEGGGTDEQVTEGSAGNPLGRQVLGLMEQAQAQEQEQKQEQEEKVQQVQQTQQEKQENQEKEQAQARAQEEKEQKEQAQEVRLIYSATKLQALARAAIVRTAIVKGMGSLGQLLAMPGTIQNKSGWYELRRDGKRFVAQLDVDEDENWSVGTPPVSFLNWKQSQRNSFSAA